MKAGSIVRLVNSEGLQIDPGSLAVVCAPDHFVAYRRELIRRHGSKILREMMPVAWIGESSKKDGYYHRSRFVVGRVAALS